jgi:hypothetical protein
MKAPHQKLPPLPPFPHEYAQYADYLLRIQHYNMRVRLWDFIRAAAKTDPEGRVPVRVVLLMAYQKWHEEEALRAKERLASEIQVDRLLDNLGLRTDL